LGGVKSGGDITISNGIITVNEATTADTLKNLTATVAELNHLDGVTSNIQTQLNNKATKSTTLSGYGITNAYTKTEVDNLELITVADIDDIWGTTIQDTSLEEVTF
jgi:predicted metalloprotease